MINIIDTFPDGDHIFQCSDCKSICVGHIELMPKTCHPCERRNERRNKPISFMWGGVEIIYGDSPHKKSNNN